MYSLDLELACRHMCKLKNIDPDVEVQKYITGGYCIVKQWELFKDEILHISHILKALKSIRHNDIY